MTHTAVLILIGTVAGIALLLISLRWRAADEDGLPGLLAASDESPGPRWLGPAMRVLISLVMLGAALYVILSKDYDAATDKWAFGMAGTVAGFWLREI